MIELELLAPARNMDIGIAAIDCGADAVYMAGPKFGARQAAGNEIEDLAALCNYAHKFGSRIFVTLNTILYEDDLADASRQMMQVQEAGADAIIVQDLAFVELARRDSSFQLPLHASTQCAIRTPEHAVWLESLGFSRLILERELSLEQIRAIRAATSCELEFFVHGALCVCYSGQCYLSQMIAGRSANRGACIQACRSRYDLVDAQGNVLVRDKALLSLKDFNLKDRMEELADAGVSSFKIEGRLKNESYVRNVVSDYSSELNRLVSNHPATFTRSSFGTVSGGFTPDLSKTFNRGYTTLFIDATKGKWASMEAAKSMGEYLGTVCKLSRDKSWLEVDSKGRKLDLANGDGFSFVAADSTVVGFRGDVCSGNTVRCKSTPSLYIGAKLFRNISIAFEKEIERNKSIREIIVSLRLEFSMSDQKSFLVRANATSEDGRSVSEVFDAGNTLASNRERMVSLIMNQLGKSSMHYRFVPQPPDDDAEIPLMSASFLNGIRRSITQLLENHSCKSKALYRVTDSKPSVMYPESAADYRQNISNHLSGNIYIQSGAKITGMAYELAPVADAELMRTKYCIRHELGICLKECRDSRKLFLVNNGRRFALGFDCSKCEMTVSAHIPEPQK